MRRLLLVAVLGILLQIFPHTAWGQDNPGDTLTVKVNHVATISEKLGEKITVLLKFNSKAKIKTYENLVEKRMAEIAYVVNNKKYDDVEDVASRYATYLGILANYAEKKKVFEEKGDILSLFERHEKIISLLQKSFEYDSGWWLAIQHDINTIKIFKDRVQKL